MGFISCFKIQRLEESTVVFIDSLIYSLKSHHRHEILARMTRSSERVREELWEKTVKKVGAHGGEVTRFIDLLNDKGLDLIYGDKEYHRSMPFGNVGKLGFTGENRAAWTTTTEWNGVIHKFPALVFEDFDKMMKMMDEDVSDSFIYDSNDKIKTHTDFIKEWSSDAVAWAANLATMYTCILTGTFAFGGIDESLNLPTNVFKNKSKAPRTFKEAFPNIYMFKLPDMKKARKFARDYPEIAPGSWTPPTPEGEHEDPRLKKVLSTEDLAKIVATLSDHKNKRKYEQAEEKRAEKRTLFTKKKVHSQGSYWYTADLECHRMYAPHIDSFLEEERRYFI